MINYRRFVSSVLLVSSLGFLSPSAVAAPKDCGPTGMRGEFWEHRGERMAQHQQKLHDALNLTPDQEGAWKKLMDSERPMARPEPGKAEEWAKLTTPERADRMLARLQEQQSRMTAHVAALKDFYAVLTPEQKKTFDDFHAAPRAGMRAKPAARAMDRKSPGP
jgi:protein CpxP